MSNTSFWDLLGDQPIVFFLFGALEVDPFANFRTSEVGLRHFVPVARRQRALHAWSGKHGTAEVKFLRSKVFSKKTWCNHLRLTWLTCHDLQTIKKPLQTIKKKLAPATGRRSSRLLPWRLPWLERDWKAEKPWKVWPFSNSNVENDPKLSWYLDWFSSF